MGQERRRFFRVTQAFDAHYHRAGELTTLWTPMTVLNLSAVGVRFRSAEPLDVGTHVEVRIQLPIMQQALLLKGEVVWVNMQASGVTEHGVELVDVDLEAQAQIDRLVEFLRQRP